MRRASLIAVAAFGVAGSVLSAPTQAALMDYDGFNYNSTTLNGENGGTGWNGGWFTTGTSPSNTLSNDGVSLSYPVPFESPMTTPATVGSRVSTGGLAANAASTRLMSETTDLSQDGNVLYASTLIRKNAPNGGAVNNDNILLEFFDSLGNRRFGLGIVGNGDQPWLNANGSTSAATPVVPGDTYFMVAKIVSSAGSPDQAFLKVYGTGYGSEVPVSEPTTWDATISTSTGANLDRVRIRMDPGNTAAAPGEVDEIRLGRDWATVVGVPEPTAAALLALGSVGLLARRRRA